MCCSCGDRETGVPEQGLIRRCLPEGRAPDSTGRTGFTFRLGQKKFQIRRTLGFGGILLRKDTANFLFISIFNDSGEQT